MDQVLRPTPVNVFGVQLKLLLENKESACTWNHKTKKSLFGSMEMILRISHNTVYKLIFQKEIRLRSFLTFASRILTAHNL